MPYLQVIAYILLSEKLSKGHYDITIKGQQQQNKKREMKKTGKGARRNKATRDISQKCQNLVNVNSICLSYAERGKKLLRNSRVFLEKRIIAMEKIKVNGMWGRPEII